MTHRPRPGVTGIDCQGDGPEEAMRFWSGALGRAFRPDPEHPGFAGGDMSEDEPFVAPHRVDHESRAHLHFENDDQAAEAARLARRGARDVARVKGWIRMGAPTGHLFCLDPAGTDRQAVAKEFD